jgi:uncharacterized protein HemY
MFRQRLGNEFMDFVQYFKTQPGREESIKYMIFKRLKHCPTHEALEKELQVMLEKNITNLENLAGRLSIESVGDLFLHTGGKLLLKEKSYPNALANFKKALSYSPLNHDIHFIH